MGMTPGGRWRPSTPGPGVGATPLAAGYAGATTGAGLTPGLNHKPGGATPGGWRPGTPGATPGQGMTGGQTPGWTRAGGATPGLARAGGVGGATPGGWRPGTPGPGATPGQGNLAPGQLPQGDGKAIAEGGQSVDSEAVAVRKVQQAQQEQNKK